MRALLLLCGAVIAVSVWWRRHPSPCPYNQRFWLRMHPLITHERLHRTLVPREGERMLELGPGTGYYTLPLARWLGREGRLDIFDIQQPMLDHTERLAREAGLTVHPSQGDAQQLPYQDGTFDAVVLTGVLGEIPDQVQALREMRRVVKPGGRVVIGELVGDPHVVLPKALRGRANQADLAVEHIDGPALGYYARLRPA